MRYEDIELVRKDGTSVFVRFTMTEKRVGSKMHRDIKQEVINLDDIDDCDNEY